MKLSEVPQEPKDFREGDKLKKLMYALDNEGHYTSSISAGWSAENVVMKNAWEDLEQQQEHTAQRVRNGELSPLAWYMEKNIMTPALLAQYIGKWTWQVKRHFKPAVFSKLSAATLEKYARIFNVTIEQLKNPFAR